MKKWYEVQEQVARIARKFEAGELNQWSSYAELLLWMSDVEAARTLAHWIDNPDALQGEYGHKLEHAQMLWVQERDE